MGDDVAIRRLDVDDADLLENLPESFDLGPVSWPHARAFLAEPRHVLIAAVAGRRMVGCLLGHELILLDGAEMLLYSIDTLEPYRRLGIGTRMVELLRQIAVARELDCMWVPTDESNRVAMRFYESLGAVRERRDDVIFTFDVPGRSERRKLPRSPAGRGLEGRGHA